MHFQCQKGMKTEVGHWLEISRIHITAQQVLDLNPFSLFPPALWQSLISTRVSPVQVHINKIPVRIQVECLLSTDHIVPCLVNHQAAVYSTGPICLSHPCHIMGVGPGLHMAISWPRLLNESNEERLLLRTTGLCSWDMPARRPLIGSEVGLR